MHIAHSSKKNRFFASGGSAAAARPLIAKAKATPHAMRSNMPGIRCLVHRRIATIWQLVWGQRPVQHILWLDAKPARISLLVANSKSCLAAFAWRNVLQVNVAASLGGRAIWWCIWVWIYQIDAKAWRTRCMEFVPRAFCRRNGPTEWETGGWNLVEVGFGKNLNFFTRTLPTWSLWSLQPGIVVVKIKAVPYCNNVST